MVRQRIYIRGDLPEEEVVDLMVRWLADLWGWDDEERRQAGLDGEGERLARQRAETERAAGESDGGGA